MSPCTYVIAGLEKVEGSAGSPCTYVTAGLESGRGKRRSRLR